MNKLSCVVERLRVNGNEAAQVEPEAHDMAAIYDTMVTERREQIRRTMGIPPRVLKLLGSVTETEAVKAAREFLGNAGRSLLLMAGGTGCGKTVAACVALDEYATIEWVNARNVGRFVKAIDLVRAGTFDSEFWDDLAEAPMLVVDDLGTEPLDEKGWALANFASLIDQRYDNCRKTILTTNLDAARFKARYCAADGGRLVDRIREAGAFVEFDGESLRVPA